MIPRFATNLRCATPSNCTKTCSRLRIEGISDNLGVAHSFGSTPGSTIEKRTNITTAVCSESSYLGGKSVIEVRRNRTANYNNTDEFASLVLGTYSKLIALYSPVVAVDFSNILVCFTECKWHQL